MNFPAVLHSLTGINIFIFNLIETLENIQSLVNSHLFGSTFYFY